MFRIFRQLRKKLIEEGSLRKYMAYAFGEILLVVAGILIALQINNANQARQERQALDGYLNSIAKNVRSDLGRAVRINMKREQYRTDTRYIFFNIWWRINGFGRFRDNNRYTSEDVGMVSQTFMSMSQPDYLNANTSGFESLKNSGYLAKLQGTDLEELLFDYYSLVNELTLEENNYNRMVLDSYQSFQEASTEIDRMTPFYNPEFRIWTDKFLEFYRPIMITIMDNQSLRQVMLIPYELISVYENLVLTGRELIRMIDENRLDHDEAALASLNNVFDEYGEKGYYTIMKNGAVSGYYSTAAASPVNDNPQFYDFDHGYTVIDFPATDWGVFYFYNGSGSLEQLRVKDFSEYKSLRMELKGAKGGETFHVSLKDESNPTDGSETKVPLTISNEWAYYEIPLDSFAPTDLSKLFMVASFVFEREPSRIMVRNIEYVR
jgi:hypothetical protein